MVCTHIHLLLYGLLHVSRDELVILPLGWVSSSRCGSSLFCQANSVSSACTISKTVLCLSLLLVCFECLSSVQEAPCFSQALFLSLAPHGPGFLSHLVNIAAGSDTAAASVLSLGLPADLAQASLHSRSSPLWPPVPSAAVHRLAPCPFQCVLFLHLTFFSCPS